MCEPNDDWTCNFDASPELTKSGTVTLPSEIVEPGNRSLGSVEVDCGFTFPRGQSASEDEDELTEAKIRAFLDEKVASDEIVQLHLSHLVQDKYSIGCTNVQFAYFDFFFLAYSCILLAYTKNYTNPFSFSFLPSLPSLSFLAMNSGSYLNFYCNCRHWN